MDVNNKLIERTIRAERLAFDMAKLCAAVEEWTRYIRPTWSSKPVVRSVIDAFDELNKNVPDWRQQVHEMGIDTDEYPLG